jgi:hypothetical protein
MPKTVAIVQSNYIPWKGYFDLINQVDEFVLYDEVQYTVRDWRNRNRIKTPAGSTWLSIPVRQDRFQKIKDAVVSDPGWARTHWRTVSWNYARAPYFRAYRESLEAAYVRSAGRRHLSEINYDWICLVCRLLGIDTPITWSMSYPRGTEDRTGRLIEICRQAHADTYLSGPAAKAYIDEEAFRCAGVTLRYVDYSGYPEYPQLYPPFDHFVSILDLLLMHGEGAVRYLKTFASRRSGHECGRYPQAG